MKEGINLIIKIAGTFMLIGSLLVHRILGDLNLAIYYAVLGILFYKMADD